MFNKDHIQRNGTDIYLLRYEEFDPHQFDDKLTPREIERLHSFKHVRRKREFVATRLLRHDVLGFEHIHYDTHGAPYINNEGFISISHCKNLVGFAINNDYQIGFDLEAPRDNILSLKDKFLSDDEKGIFDSTNIELVTRLWSAKEVLYKLAGRKQIIFKEELLLMLKGDKDLFGRIINRDHEISVKLDIFDYDGTIISINSEAVERKY